MERRRSGGGQRTLSLALSMLLWVTAAGAIQSGIGGPREALLNDSCADATTIAAGSYTDRIVTSTATTEPTDPIPECAADSQTPAGKSVWYRFTTPGSGTLTADTLGEIEFVDTDYDTILSAYTGTCGGLNPVPDGCSDDDPFDGAQSKVSFQTPAGTTYYFMVSAFNDNGGNLMFRLRFLKRGDANCDERTTAADLPAVIKLIASGRPAPCGADANQDGDLDADDVDAVTGAIFAP